MTLLTWKNAHNCSIFEQSHLLIFVTIETNRNKFRCIVIVYNITTNTVYRVYSIHCCVLWMNINRWMRELKMRVNIFLLRSSLSQFSQSASVRLSKQWNRFYCYSNHWWNRLQCDIIVFQWFRFTERHGADDKKEAHIVLEQISIYSHDIRHDCL